MADEVPSVISEVWVDHRLIALMKFEYADELNHDPTRRRHRISGNELGKLVWREVNSCLLLFVVFRFHLVAPILPNEMGSGSPQNFARVSEHVVLVKADTVRMILYTTVRVSSYLRSTYTSDRFARSDKVA